MPQETSTTIVAGDAAILARRYAGALFDLASEQKQLDAVAADLRLLSRVRRESLEFQQIAEHPGLTRAQLSQQMEKLAAAAGFNKLTSNFISLLGKNRRLDCLGAMIDAFLADLAELRGEFTAEVRSAQELSPAQQEQLASKLTAWVGGKVHLALSTDPELLGGFVVKMGSRVIDASVKTRLANLERQLNSQNTTLEGAA